MPRGTNAGAESAAENPWGEPAAPHATGGGTYAKVLKQGVAYGAAFPEDEDLAHQANEYIRVSQMVKAMKIYAAALMKLAAE